MLQRTNMENVVAMLVYSQLRWAGHVVSLPNDRLPKAAMYGEFTSQQKKGDRQKLCCKHGKYVLKRQWKTADIHVRT